MGNKALIFTSIVLLLVVGGLVYVVTNEANKCVIDPITYKLKMTGVFNNYKCECNAFDPKLGNQRFEINGGVVSFINDNDIKFINWDIPYFSCNQSCNVS